jgi:3-dehydroquinate synthase
MMKTKSVFINLGVHGYPVMIGADIYHLLPEHIANIAANRQVAIVTVPPVAHFYLEKVIAVFQSEWQIISYQVPDGEESKTMEQAQHLYSWLIRSGFERKGTIITLGGGVVGDLAGFVAATYMRGINLVHLPTTLLAQVDSSIGGKVGINHPQGKNLIGAFYQPHVVLTDVSALETLPTDEFVCGMAEVVKYGFIYDDGLFKRIESAVDKLNQHAHDELLPVIQRCVAIKSDVVMQDERESGLRAILNFGHTFAHAFESFYHYQGLKHGQAVLLGMKCALAVSRELDLLGEPALKRGLALIDRIGVKWPAGIRKPAVGDLLQFFKHDKKVAHGVVNLVLLTRIGEARVVPVDDEAVIARGFESVLGE